jgi:protein-S-isoprenylcysteine O-methyltransferase Ste14
MSERDLYDGFLVAWLLLSGFTLVFLLVKSAPYGRHAREGWGPKVSSRTGWILMEAPAALVIALFFWLAPPVGRLPWLFLGLWELHYLNRAFVFPFRMRGGHKPMPLVVALMGVAFNAGNGYLNGRGLTVFQPAWGERWTSDPRFVVGVALFFAGFAINLHADQVLFNLRKPGETGYKIPRGGLYRFVSCPNYLGEILEWSGFAVATWTPGAAAFAVWTAANLIPRAITHHRWYRSTFPDYPAARRAILPFLV